MRVMMILALAFSLISVVACSSGDNGGVPTEKPLVHGTITQKDGARILVEEQPNQQSGDAKCWFTITDKTTVFRQNGKLVDKAATADLAVGQKVSAWATGGVLESYPCQATAATVLIFP